MTERWQLSAFQTTAVSYPFFKRTENESDTIADSDEDMTDYESRHSRFSWLRLLIAVLGKRAMSCSDEQMRFSNTDRGGLESFPDNFSKVV